MANAYERSLVRVGDGGLTLLIPKPWADYYSLSPGDIVRIKTNSELVVEPVVIGKWKRRKRK